MVASTEPARAAAERWPTQLSFVETSAVTAHGHGAYSARVLATRVDALRVTTLPEGSVVCAEHEAASGGAGPFVCYRVEASWPTFAVRARRDGAIVREGRLDECAGCHDAGPRLRAAPSP